MKKKLHTLNSRLVKANNFTRALENSPRTDELSANCLASARFRNCERMRGEQRKGESKRSREKQFWRMKGGGKKNGNSRTGRYTDEKKRRKLSDGKEKNKRQWRRV